ncbi:MAG: hypothetical protein Q9201_003820 [Fulgogasparrea decipioides]
MFPPRTESLNKWLAQGSSPKSPDGEHTLIPAVGDRVEGETLHYRPLAVRPAKDTKSRNNEGNPQPAETGKVLEETLSQTSFNPRALQPKKRKISLPAVDLGRMTVVQEAFVDSPTIPGRPPLLERSMSVPALTLRRLSEEPNQLTPRAAEFSNPDKKERSQPTSQPGDPELRPAKRSSSLMGMGLPPLIIPTAAPKDQKLGQPASSDLRIFDALPPKVPPKSPRTESRASPHINKAQHSAHSSISTECSSASSAASACSILGHASPQLVSVPRRTGSPLSRSSPMSAVKNLSPDSLWSKICRLESPARHVRTADHAEKQIPQHVGMPLTWNATSTPHSRGTSEASTTRGRPERKDSHFQRSQSKSTVRSPSSRKWSLDLPVGFKVSEAPRQLAEIELRSLKQQADEQVASFEVLQAKDVASLSKELRQLDDRCEYLQRTYQSLQQGRKSLHTRMISYLRSPHLTNFSRDSILKQEEVLADIDDSIGDWIRKSEQAENRRTRIRQKLLEHVAAALTLRPNGTTGSLNIPEEHTPPESPEHDDDFPGNPRRDFQSIKIYADAGVAALLAEIDKEIGFIGSPPKARNR